MILKGREATVFYNTLLFMRVTHIEDIGGDHPADEEVLHVYTGKRQSSVAFVLLGVLMLVGIYFAFGRASSVYVKIGVFTFLFLIIRLLMVEYQKKPVPQLTISREGIRFYHKDLYPWHSISEVVYEEDDAADKPGLLVLRFYQGGAATFAITPQLDRSLEVIAAYINKYNTDMGWER